MMLTATRPTASACARMPLLTSYADGTPHEVTLDARVLSVSNRVTGSLSQWTWERSPETVQLALLEGRSAHAATHLLAALDALFMLDTGCKSMALADASPFEELIDTGVLLPKPDGHGLARAEMLWQQPRLWLPSVRSPMAQQFVLTNGKYHPRRPPKPRGTLYRRFIPWLGKTFSFRSLDLARDLPAFTRWMNDPEVARIWEEEGDLDRHRTYLSAIDLDPHMYSMIASFDDEPFAYFEVYWAKESRIAPFYDVHDYDRGWHVLVGEPSFRGKAYATAWLTSISHYIFLCDPRTQRAVGEPRIDHVQQIRNLDKSGYAKVKEFDLPHKRAQLVVMLREHYFCDALWLPRAGEPTAARPA